MRGCIDRPPPADGAGLAATHVQPERVPLCVYRPAGGRALMPAGVSDRYTAIALIGLAADGLDRWTLPFDPVDMANALVAGLPRSNNLGDAALIAWAARAVRADSARGLGARSATVQPATPPTRQWKSRGRSRPRSSTSDTPYRRCSNRCGLRCCRPGIRTQHCSAIPRAAAARDRMSPVSPTRSIRSSRWRARRPTRRCRGARRGGALCAPHLRAAGRARPMVVALRSPHRRRCRGLSGLCDPPGRDGADGAARDRGRRRRRLRRARSAAVCSGSASTPELQGGTLIDEPAQMLWRKVARREPMKATRYLQAAVTMLHPTRAPGWTSSSPPVTIDYEDRPYHWGWFLYCRGQPAQDPHRDMPQSATCSASRWRRVTMDEVLPLVDAAMPSGVRSRSASSTPPRSSTCSATRGCAMTSSPSDIVLADGMSLVWASRLVGRPLPERVAGIDLMFRPARALGGQGHRVFCLGATPTCSKRRSPRSRARYPAVIIAGSHHGYFSVATNRAWRRRSPPRAPTSCFIAMTSPRKEQFLAQWSRVLDVPVWHGVGGSFDVAAGKVARAPMLWQRLGLEWLYRVKQEPRRLWKRYLVTNTIFARMLFREWLRRPARALAPLPADDPPLAALRLRARSLRLRVQGLVQVALRPDPADGGHRASRHAEIDPRHPGTESVERAAAGFVARGPAARRRRKLKWDLPGAHSRDAGVLSGVVLIGLVRMVADRAGLGRLDCRTDQRSPDQHDQVGHPGAAAVRRLPERTRFRQGRARGARRLSLLGVQVIKWMPLSSAAAAMPWARSLKILVNEVGYHRVNISAMLAGGPGPWSRRTISGEPG